MDGYPRLVKRRAKFFFLFLSIAAALPVSGFAHDLATAYGAYPTNYQEVVTAWLETQLYDAKGAKIKWLGEPKQAELAGEDGAKITGYLVEFSVNAKNRFGAYTGAQKHGALIRDGKVIKATGGFGYR
jgi:hypothetical protein